MKIGIDIRMMGKQHGGIGRYVFELASRIPKLDFQNKYIFFYNQSRVLPEDLIKLKNLPNVALIAANYRHYSLKEQTLFLRLLNQQHLDLVHFPNFNAPIFYDKPFVVTIHDMVHHKISGAKKSRFLHFLAYKKIIASAAKKAQKIITVSESSKTDIQKFLGIGREKIKVILEGSSLTGSVNDKTAREIQNKYLLTRPYFLFVGVWERKKNLINLALGFNQFLEKYKFDMDLVICGKPDAHYPEIKLKLMQIKHKDRLVIIEKPEDEDLAALYQGAFAFTSASLHEGFGLSGVEAMNFGLPLIVSNTPVFNEIYDNAAIYFNSQNPNDIADKMNLLINDSLFYNKMGEASLARSTGFSWDNAAKETLELYNQVQ